MDLLQLGMQLTKALLSLLLHPMLYVSIVLIYLQYRRQALMERTLFHVRVHSEVKQTVTSIGAGVLGGVIASALLLALGVVLRPADILLLWIVTLVLVLWNVRFFCFAYAGGILAIAAHVAEWWPQGAEAAAIAGLWKMLLAMDGGSLLALVAILHLTEGILLRLYGERGASPLFIRSKRGRLVGAFQMQKFWPVPLFVLAGATEGEGFRIAGADGWPLFAGDAAALLVLPLPAVIGYADLAIASTKKEKVAYSSFLLFLYGMLLLLMALLTKWAPAAALFAGLFAVVGHELILYYGKWREWSRPPLYIQGKEGIRILEVIPGSPAAEMGIEAGERIVKVNGIKVDRKEDLYPALQANSAFCKIEVENREGVAKYLQRSLYEGEHHQLGIIIAPDLESEYYVEPKGAHLLALLRQRIERLKRDRLGA